MGLSNGVRWAMSVDDETGEGESFEVEAGDFVPAFFARDLEEAEEYCELLSDHDIPARAGVDAELAQGDSEQRVARRRGMTHGVPVLVPETLLDEASEVIADREDLADFSEDELEEDEDEDDEVGEEFGLVAPEDGREEDEGDEEDDDEESSFLLGGEEEEEEEEAEEGDGLFGDEDELESPDDDEEF
jgi:hypothetical protein